MPFEVSQLRPGVFLLRSTTTQGYVMSTRVFYHRGEADTEKGRLDEMWAPHRKTPPPPGRKTKSRVHVPQNRRPSHA